MPVLTIPIRKEPKGWFLEPPYTTYEGFRGLLARVFSMEGAPNIIYVGGVPCSRLDTEIALWQAYSACQWKQV